MCHQQQSLIIRGVVKDNRERGKGTRVNRPDECKGSVCVGGGYLVHIKERRYLEGWLISSLQCVSIMLSYPY